MNKNDTIYPSISGFQLSPLSSLNFDNNWRLDFQTPCCYEQRFARLDRIRAQYAGTDKYPFIVYLTDRVSGQVKTLDPTVISNYDNPVNNDSGKVYELLLDSLPDGLYMLSIYMQIDTYEVLMAKSFFSVIEDDGTLMRITYSNRRNDFDTIFSDNRMFDFRVEGCFLPADTSFGVDNDGFRDQTGKYKQLFALPYRKEKLTIGGGFGVPNWVADKLNYIFSTSFVLIDGIKYVRSDSSVPEVTSLHIDYPKFVYKLEVERDQNFANSERLLGEFNADYNDDYNIQD